MRQVLYSWSISVPVNMCGANRMTMQTSAPRNPHVLYEVPKDAQDELTLAGYGNAVLDADPDVEVVTVHGLHFDCSVWRD